MRQTQLEKCYFLQSTIIVVTVEALLTKTQMVKEMGRCKIMNTTSRSYSKEMFM